MMNENKTIKIDKAKPEHLGELHNLFVKTIKSTCSNDYTEKQIEVWTSSIKNQTRWLKKIQSQYFLIAKISDKIIGFGSLESGNYVDLLYVHRNYTRQGVASILFEELKNESLRLGFNKLTTDSSITARAFFEKKGFKINKENRNHIKDIEVLNYYMSQ